MTIAILLPALLAGASVVLLPKFNLTATEELAIEDPCSTAILVLMEKLPGAKATVVPAMALPELLWSTCVTVLLVLRVAPTTPLPRSVAAIGMAASPTPVDSCVNVPTFDVFTNPGRSKHPTKKIHVSIAVAQMEKTGFFCS